MILVRLAIATFAADPARDVFAKKIAAAIDHVSISSHHVTANGIQPDVATLLLMAEVQLPYLPPLSDTGKISVPTDQRRLAENGIETLAALVSVSENCSRTLSSPEPCIGFRPHDANEQSWLDGLQRIEGGPSAIPKGDPRFDIDMAVLSKLGDRLDGVALLAEAMAQPHPAGKYKDFIRLFERAFALPATQIDKKLYQFLTAGPCENTRLEIQDWIKHRHAAFHADGKKVKRIALEGDFRPFIARMEEAAYDVLINKAHWALNSSGRRDLWRPVCVTTSISGNMTIIQRSTPRVSFQVLDQFGVYPLHMGGILTSPPAGIWFAPPKPPVAAPGGTAAAGQSATDTGETSHET